MLSWFSFNYPSTSVREWFSNFKTSPHQIAAINPDIKLSRVTNGGERKKGGYLVDSREFNMFARTQFHEYKKKYSALPKYRDLFSPSNSRETPIARP